MLQQDEHYRLGALSQADGCALDPVNCHKPIGVPFLDISDAVKGILAAALGHEYARENQESENSDDY
jgi:hypothetical protein